MFFSRTVVSCCAPTSRGGQIGEFNRPRLLFSVIAFLLFSRLYLPFILFSIGNLTFLYLQSFGSLLLTSTDDRTHV